MGKKNWKDLAGSQQQLPLQHRRTSGD